MRTRLRIEGDEAMTEAEDRRAAQQQVVVELLAQGSSYADVAQEVGITSRTIPRWMADGEFRRRVSDRRGEILGEVTGQLVASAHDVVGQLRVEVFGAERSSDRIRAAQVYMGTPGTRRKLGGCPGERISGPCGSRRRSSRVR
jgi:transposase-like protein